MTEYSFTHEGHDYEIHAPDGRYFRVTRDGETVGDSAGLSAWSPELGWDWPKVCHLSGSALTSVKHAHLRRIALREASDFDRIMLENAGDDE